MGDALVDEMVAIDLATMTVAGVHDELALMPAARFADRGPGRSARVVT